MFIFRLTQVRTSKSEVQTGSGAHSTSVDERGSAAEYKIPWPRSPKGGPAPDYIARMCLSQH
jgi:hypothetical protein